MTVFEALEMLGRHEKYKIIDHEFGLIPDVSSYEMQNYSDEFPKEVFDTLLEKTAYLIDLEERTIITKMW